MDYAEQLQILSAAQGDPAALALALVDLTFHAEPTEERAALRAALEAAAIPHWITPALLAALLGIAEDEAAARLVRLRHLTVVEPFPARGEGACNVHEQARLALRRRLAEQEPERFRTLSARAAEAFAGGNTPAERIEHAGHLCIAEPVEAADEILMLLREWGRSGRIEEKQALASMCSELLGLGTLIPLVRGQASETVGWVQQEHLPAAELEGLAGEAVASYRKTDDEARLAWALTLLGEARRKGGKPALAAQAYSEALSLRRRMVALDPASAERQRDVSVSLNKLGGLDREQGRSEEARKAYAEGLEIFRRLAALDPANTEWQRDVSVSLDTLGDLDREQGRPEEARKAYAEGLEIRHRLVALDPANTLWQRDVNHSLHLIGRLVLDGGGARAAIPLFIEALGISERLAALDPQNVMWQQDVRANRYWLTRAQQAAGEEPGASA